MSDVFTIGGAVVDLNAEYADPIRFTERFGEIPSLTIQKRGVALPGTDPWVGKEITWANGGTTRFVGDVVGVSPSFTGLGWVLTYQCLGLRNRLDWFPHTDSNTGVASSPFNLQPENSLYNPARAGRTVGQILASVLTMPDNAAWCDLCGIGNYTGLPTSPTLPGVTTADLALMTAIPPHEVYVGSDKFGMALDGFVQQWAPNYRMWVDPDGNFRFKDIRTFPPATFTMGYDPVEPSDLTRDVGDCFQRVVARGQPIAVLAVLKLSDGDLVENFAHDGLTNAQAKAAWTPADFQQPGTAQDTGTCTCTTTTTIVVTSSSGSTAWVSGYWDQSHQQGWINLSSSTIAGYTQYWSARIVACTALSAGGSSTITIDSPMPATSYDKYTITGLATGGSVVWTQYQIANTNLWPRVTSQTTYPQPLVSPGGGNVSLTSSAVGIILWSLNGSPPYMSFPSWFTFNSTTGNLRFASPTWMIANNAPPADVWAAIPIQTNPNTAIEPPDISGVPQYSGTSHSVDGLTKTLTIDLDDWRDPGSLPQVQAYASEVLDAVSNAVIEGSVVYYGLYPAALDFGMSVNVAGADGGVIAYPTGWESAALPVLGVDVDWTQDEGMLYRTTLHCSNRKDIASAEMFMHPQRTGLAIGTPDGDVYNPFGIAQSVEERNRRKRDGQPGLDVGGSRGFGMEDDDGRGEGRSKAGRGEGQPINPDAMGGMGMGGGLFPSFADLGIPTDMNQWAAENGVPTDLGAYMQGIGADPASYGLDFGPNSYAGIPGIPGKPRGKKGAKAADRAKPDADAAKPKADAVPKPPEPAKKAAENAKKADAEAKADAGEPKKDGEAKAAKAKHGRKPRPPKPPRKKQHGLRPSAEFQERKDREDAARKKANADHYNESMDKLRADDPRGLGNQLDAARGVQYAKEAGGDRDKAIERAKTQRLGKNGQYDPQPLTPTQIKEMDRILSHQKTNDAIKQRQADNAKAREDMMNAAKPDQDKKAADQQQGQRDAIKAHDDGFNSRVKDREDFMENSPQAKQRKEREDAIAAGKADAAERKGIGADWDKMIAEATDPETLAGRQEGRKQDMGRFDAMHDPDPSAVGRHWDKVIQDEKEGNNHPMVQRANAMYRDEDMKKRAAQPPEHPSRIAARNQQIERDEREAANAQRKKEQQQRQADAINAPAKKKDVE